MESLPLQKTFAIKSYDYKKGIPAYKASIVDLTLVAITSLNNIDVSTKFGAEFYKLSGQEIHNFLNLLCEMYETHSISDPHSVDYRTSYNFWFLEAPLKRRVKYAELHLDNAVHKLNLLLNVLIIQLRTKLDLLKKVHLSSNFSESLIVELDKLLNTLPPQQQKEIVVTDKKEQVEEGESLPIKTVSITYEPFIEHVNAAFNEASKLKRLNNLDNNVERTSRKMEPRTQKKHNPRNESPVRNEQKKKEKHVDIPDSEGWIVKRNKK